MTPVRQQSKHQAWLDQEDLIKKGIVSAGPVGFTPSAEALKKPELNPFLKRLLETQAAIKNNINAGLNLGTALYVRNTQPVNRFNYQVQKKIADIRKSNPVAVVPTPTATPTPTPDPYPTYGPTQPQNIPQTYYTNRQAPLEPSFYDAVNTATASPEEKRMLMALGTQESQRGYVTTGDSGKSKGVYHINLEQRPNITETQALDPVWSTNYALTEMRRNMSKGTPLSGSLKSWNPLSGYVNKGPKYDKDIPEMATTSSFWRGKK